MANWAKLQEDLVGLPVYKRAKHGIHFDKGNGEILANFSGRPCHFEEGGIWKPIDTKLLALGDGFYGCPHSKVKVHPDGRVAIAGTDYVQRVELPSAQTGLLDGDKLIRKFSFGEQRMWVTEDGFRSEIQLNRIPTLTEAKKLIATESGTLSAECLKSLTTAEDAKGNVHTITTLTAFRTWLASAVFPVVIDPDFSTTSTSGDTELQSANPDRNRGASADASAFDAGTSIKHLFRFDCSSIDSGNVCSSAVLAFTKLNAVLSSDPYTVTWYSIASGNGDWIEGTKANSLAGTGETCWNYKGYNTVNWAGSAGMSTAGTDYENTVLGTMAINRADAQYSNWTSTFNASGIARVQNWFGATNTNYGIVGWTTRATNNIVAFSENTTASYRPVLTVTYTAGGVPKQFMHYQRMRG